MKKLFTIIILLAVLLIWARPATETEMQKVAESRLASENINAMIYETTAIVDFQGNHLVNIYNLDPAGFIIVTTNTDLIPVYAYSFRNNFSLDENNNPGLTLIREDIPLRLQARNLIDPEITNTNRSLWQAYLQNQIPTGNNRDRSVYPPSSYNTPTGGWIVTQWDQGYPYNQFCPVDPDGGGRCVVGCVATAFAQIVNYHRTIGDLTFSDDDDYVSDNYTSPLYIDDDHETYNFLSFPELNVWMDDLRDTYANGYTFNNEHKAALSFACGILTQMQYSSGGSGTQTLFCGFGFMNRLGYDTAVNVYSINNSFYNTLSDDMVNGRPVLISIHGSMEGHAIIVDGWNSESDYYHLNMGWSGYDDGWYSLPEGMPSGYNVISDAVVNIEGGTVPVDILGFVNAPGASPDGTVVELDGAVDYICQTDETGIFELAFVHEGFYNLTATLALPNGGYFFNEQQIYIDASNTFFQIDMDNFQYITGNITAPEDLSNAHIDVYSDDGIVSSGEINNDGSYQIPGLLPGTYTMVASMSPHYGRIIRNTIDLEHQNFDFELFQYEDFSEISYASDPVSDWSLIATTMSIGIKLTEDETAAMDDALISQVNFVAPIDPENGQLWAQVWRNELLISEKEITDFTYGEEMQVQLDNFVPVDSQYDYYVGYKIQSSNAVLAWVDDGPRVPGKGAFFRTNSWTEVNTANDFNFCIEAQILNPILPVLPDEVLTSNSILQQNYPNPFNPVTNISFELNDPQTVNLNIYNTKGQLVKTLLRQHCPSGLNTVAWDGSNQEGKTVASGVFFYVLKTENAVESRKMILLK